ncbi:MAG: hypothetical protein ACLP1X_24925 [Polyangiaceae bacterium]
MCASNTTCCDSNTVCNGECCTGGECDHQNNCCLTNVLDGSGNCCSTGVVDAQGNCCGGGSVVCSDGLCCEGACTSIGSCCTGGTLAVCGEGCCTGTDVCINAFNSTCGPATQPTLILQDDLGNNLAMSPNGTSDAIVTQDYVIVVEGFPSSIGSAWLTVTIGTTVIDQFPATAGVVYTISWVPTLAEEGHDVQLLAEEGASQASIAVNVIPLP